MNNITLLPAPTSPTLIKMPFVMITWVPKACRDAETRKIVAAAVIKALSTGSSILITIVSFLCLSDMSRAYFVVCRHVWDSDIREMDDVHLIYLLLLLISPMFSIQFTQEMQQKPPR